MVCVSPGTGNSFGKMHRRINFGALKKSVTGAVSSAASGARDLAFDAKEAVERAMVAKCLRPYVMKEQIGTTGPKGLWRIYSAESRNPSNYSPDMSKNESGGAVMRCTVLICECVDSRKETPARDHQVSAVARATRVSWRCL